MFSFTELSPEYKIDLAACHLMKIQAAELVAHRLLQSKPRFLALQQASGVPALWTMPTFEREGPDFNAYFGNGDPLDKPTHDVPRNRGPFKTWEDGALDALKLDEITEPPELGEWTWEWALWTWERWNGFGPRDHGRPSGYLWSGTSIYKGGKYIADGVWSRGTVDKQLGTVIIAKCIAQLDPEIAAGFKS
jgi:lysozyme family protein